MVRGDVGEGVGKFEGVELLKCGVKARVNKVVRKYIYTCTCVCLQIVRAR